MANKFYLTTAIDYSNGEPHLGHAYEKLGADCIARYRRLRGDAVHFLIGMDEHGQKVAQSAEAAGVPTEEWVAELAEKFQAAWSRLDITHTDFIRTTEPRHRRTVEELLRRIKEGGYIYEGSYSGYYCVGCEAFKLEKDLEEGKCPEHPTREIKWVEEPNYFFRLSAFQDRLLEIYRDRPDFLRPASKLNEVRNVVQDGLQDLSVSRARLPWGIPWPDDPTHTVYVWFDALINYLSATGFPEAGYDRVWPADLHVIGPDIARFHAAIWPAMLMAGGVEVPGGVWSHGWITHTGARFSKSEGVMLTLEEAVGRHGSDALRYFVLREVPWDSNGNFSWERFDARYTSELADGYGNLVSRVLAMIVKYLDGTVPHNSQETSLDSYGIERIEAYARQMDAHLLHFGAQEAWDLVTRANGFIEETAPWNLAKLEARDQLEAVLGSLARCLLRITLLAQPFLPNKAQSAWEALGLDGTVADATWDWVERPAVEGRRVEKIAPMFPKPAAVKSTEP